MNDPVLAGLITAVSVLIGMYGALIVGYKIGYSDAERKYNK